MKRIEGLQDPKLEINPDYCPKCITEELIRALGNILVCPNCDLILVE